MELRQLEYFIAVVEEANFTRAAERERVAQPAVSAQISRLEREVGQPLLDRTRREVRPTAAGAAMLPYARAALAAIAGARAAVDEVASLVRGSVAIGTVTAHDVDMPGLLADFHRAHPYVDVTLGTDDTARLVDSVQSGRLDAAIISVGADTLPDGLDGLVVTDEPIVGAVAADDEWAARRSITLADLAERTVIALPSGTGIRRQLDNACAAAGLSLRVALEASTPLALADFAERGLGVAVLPQMVAASRAGLHPLPITPPLRGRLVFAWRADGPMSPASRVLIGMARDRLAVGAGA
ncbi:LysR family transcriptional regulator [Mycolicibacterium sphagni]|uniref:Probable hydrogen peroxide-inducible genes activator n=1 Tax=Mycolicibacterium sphagni TaxID=1786 RepID=A0A255DUH6_9MYCO|nr:LysR family transcriptional regulator [Mycolicibacterium sphagni]OYN80642.1 LysR family transcriptional regulator [Mycolicibacterium sphagni]